MGLVPELSFFEAGVSYERQQCIFSVNTVQKRLKLRMFDGKIYAEYYISPSNCFLRRKVRVKETENARLL